MPTKRLNDEDRRRCIRACEPCRRRKERCNGHHPCSRCVTRRAEAHCTFLSQSSRGRASIGSQAAVHDSETALLSPPLSRDTASSFGTTVSQDPCFVHHHKDDHIFLGDSATVSFLQDVRKLALTLFDVCDFNHDSIPGILLGHPPDTRTLCTLRSFVVAPEKPSPEEAHRFIRSVAWSSGFLMDLFEEAELVQSLPDWLESTNSGSHPLAEVYHLLVAIGLQVTCPDNDELAHKHFHHGYVSVLRSLDEPNITMVQCSMLIVWYLLAAARRSGAYMFLSLALQAAYALGLHRQDVGVLFPPHETRRREKLWRCIHTLDGYMATSLGRPVLTKQSIDRNLSASYSARYGLNRIFTTIQVEVYEKRRISPEIHDRVSHMQRDWARRLAKGLETDQISPDLEISTPDGTCPNMALIHLKSSYYWTIILITRHSLMESAQRITQGSINPSEWPSNVSVRVDACIDSAIKIVEMFRIFLRNEMWPRRLPLVVNATFVCALVLGTGFFADFSSRFPLAVHLDETYTLLHLFGQHDPLALEMSKIVLQLRSAAQSYSRIKTAKNYEESAKRVAKMFGYTETQTSNERQDLPYQTPPSQPQTSLNPEVPHDYTEEIVLSSTTDETPLHPNAQPVGSSQADPDLMWLDSTQTIYFGDYDEISAFFTVIDQNEIASL